MLAASLPVLAFDRYGDAKVGGWLFAAYGLGGLIGTVIAYQLVKKMAPWMFPEDTSPRRFTPARR